MSFDTLESSRHSATPVALYLLQGAANAIESVPIGPYAFCNGETSIIRDGVTYEPWTIKHGNIHHDGTLDKSDITVSLAYHHEIADLFLAYPPSQVINLTIFEGHVEGEHNTANIPAIWLGRITGYGIRGNEIDLTGSPVSTSIRRPGLRRNYQIGCPHVLYGEHCRASKAAATVQRLVSSTLRNTVTLGTGLGMNSDRYVGGLLEWTNEDTGRKELRTITAVTGDGLKITVRGTTRGMAPGTELSVVRGCNRQMSGCNQHSNIQNYGGQPFIPLENPLSQKNQFY